jgi:hypothetical protein
VGNFQPFQAICYILTDTLDSELIGIWLKIHLNPKTVISAFIIGSIQVICFQRKTLKIENGT